MRSANDHISQPSTIMDTAWWNDFFKFGAFLRLPDEKEVEKETQILLWSGPFENLSELSENEKCGQISIGYMNFFSSSMELRKTPKPPFKSTMTDLQKSLQEFQKSLKIDKNEFLETQDFKNLGFKDFEKTIQSILGKIQRGELEKAVPVVFSRTAHQATLANKVSWMLNLLQTPPNLNAFGFWEKEFGIMGATPEILFRRKNGKVTTMALAGTMPRSEIGKRNSLLKDPKELHEHQLVVEDLQRQLSKWGWVKKTPPRILELPTLLHLQTLLEIDGVNCGVKELILQLHPTPALGVAPRAYGYHWLSSTSDQEGRRVFGAPILFSIPAGPDSVESEEFCLVAIRNIQWDAEGCRVGTGCGVVNESQPDQEWQELQEKFNSVMLMLGIKGKNA